MLVDEIRRAAETAPRVKLPEVAAVLWRAYGSGHVSEAQAEELSAQIEARKALLAAAAETRAAATRRAKSTAIAHRGSAPRTPESLERRRRWAASGRMPPTLAAPFTTAEQSVLAVVAAEAARHGACTLAHGHIAAVVGVSISTVKRALRAARDRGLIEVEVRRVTAWRHDTNRVTIVSREWRAWLRLCRSEGVGVRQDPPRLYSESYRASKRPTAPSQKLPGGRATARAAPLMESDIKR